MSVYIQYSNIYKKNVIAQEMFITISFDKLLKVVSREVSGSEWFLKH
jgi:hypothetical protein